MTQAKPRFTTFADYLSYSETLEGRFQLIHGELCELPPESRFNSTIAVRILVALLLTKQLRLTEIQLQRHTPNLIAFTI
jgi:Uma2 family endonuclease